MHDGDQFDRSELARWQGRTEGQLAETARRLDQVHGAVEAVEREVGQIKVQVATIHTKVALWSAIGGIVGAGVVSAVIGIGVS